MTMAKLFTFVTAYSGLALNLFTASRALKRKKSPWVLAFVYLVIIVLSFLMREWFSQVLAIRRQFYLIFTLPIFWLYEGNPFHKLYVIFTIMLRCTLMVSAAGFVLQWILPYGSDLYFQAYTLAVLVMYAIYGFFIALLARGFYAKLFAYTGKWEWALYVAGLALTFNAYRYMYFAQGVLYQQRFIEDPLSYILFFLVCLSSYSILCYAIIKTHGKTKVVYDLQMAQQVLSSGKSYYMKMTALSEETAILRHDYRQQLNTISGLLKTGKEEDARQLLVRQYQQLDDGEIPMFSQNNIVNALLVEFEQRCKDAGIAFTAQAALPQPLAMDNYELCILLGNLLENAFDACTRPDFSDEKWVDLTIKYSDRQMAVRVQNSFDGVVKQQGDAVVSRKTGEGLGIKSIGIVAAKYGGEYMPSWENGVFTAYVLLNFISSADDNSA